MFNFFINNLWENVDNSKKIPNLKKPRFSVFKIFLKPIFYIFLSRNFIEWMVFNISVYILD